jgi:hypothetical protein
MLEGYGSPMICRSVIVPCKLAHLHLLQRRIYHPLLSKRQRINLLPRRTSLGHLEIKSLWVLRMLKDLHRNDREWCIRIQKSKPLLYTHNFTMCICCQA